MLGFVDGRLKELGIADLLYLSQRTLLLQPVDERLHGYVAWALTTLFLRSSGRFNTDPACQTAVLVRRLRRNPPCWPKRLIVSELRAPNKTSTRAASVLSLQLRVLGLGLLQDGDFGVGVFPKGEEIFVGGAGFGGIAL